MATTRAFGDPDLTPDDFSKFSKQEIAADTAAKAIERLEPIPRVRSLDPMDLANVIGQDATNEILQAKKITFHTVGDTGGIHNPQFQYAVADAMAADLKNGAAFWYHLGDVVYYFGQEQYYYEQFYDPYRDYNAPIFAIPGNHDGAVYSGQPGHSLDAFVANFCAAVPAPTADSMGAVRTTMDQPGVYFTLNAPFVKFIGLYTNTSEGGTEGVISGTKVGNEQLTFLQQQLAAAKAERDQGQWRALIIATHHPPFTGSAEHVPSPAMLKLIDKACSDAQIQPDLHLSGHAHLYERYTRTVGGKPIPYLVAGMGGYYNLPGLKPANRRPKAPQVPSSGKDASGNPLSLRVYNDTTFGFLRITVSTEPSKTITGEFVTVDPTGEKIGSGDSFTLDLDKNTVPDGLPPSGGAPSGHGGRPATGGGPRKGGAELAPGHKPGPKKG